MPPNLAQHLLHHRGKLDGVDEFPAAKLPRQEAIRSAMSRLARPPRRQADLTAGFFLPQYSRPRRAGACAMRAAGPRSLSQTCQIANKSASQASLVPDHFSPRENPA